MRVILPNIKVAALSGDFLTLAIVMGEIKLLEELSLAEKTDRAG